MTRVVVFGASGVQGAAQVAALARTGHHPVAVSRNPKPLAIDGKPIETFAADFTDEPAISRALEGAEVIFLNLPSTSFQAAGPVLAGARAVASAASRTPSVRLVVFNTSMPVPEEKRGIKAQDDRVDIRRILREEAGLPVISIQPVVFLDNLLEGWAYPPIAERSTIVYCHKPDLEVSWICHHDVAQLMIAAMDKPHLAGRNIPVGGPETVRLERLAEKLSRAWERPLAYENQTVDDFCAKISASMRERAGIDADRIITQMHKAYTHYNESPEKPFKIDMGPVLKELPVTLTPIEEWGRRTKHRLPDSSRET
ncbi:NAD(P)-binding protein [Sodiomyces alkalinus F11]|uniref:NAD(P)-binding protein n=1 Tax=Sodiomyces alkalinus (strain CBS 110278 / VKM F-3762 / F11) TaxID=1314773 RepID=A0A3N2Q7E0_SODAK|nr:NAD(P)-binding protein [Sodiomyces alkalinus F11]ROT42670.1 NAD(P)-binding protein [Sodiomyces alkalinus F11]